jgi:RHS repeat-associated protein
VALLTGTYLKNSSDTTLNSHQYTLNAGHQRTRQTRLNSDYVDYTYDPAGQLKSARGKESSGYGLDRLHEQFGYAYDKAGNLSYRTNNALVESFSVNTLNELTQAGVVDGTLTVAGTITSSATNVTVNNSNAVLYLDQTFARANHPLSDGTNTFTAVAQDSLGRSDTNVVSVNLPEGVSFSYDLNGNLLTNGTRFLEYDDENQLTRITEPNAWKSEFTYDGKMRRRVRKEYTWNGSTWQQTNEVRYIYDGNLVVQERDSFNLPTVSYTRGVDLSGTIQGAGGIGGLLALSNLRSLNPDHSYYHADGNGNITCLIASNQLVTARYLYDPFGNNLAASGPVAEVNRYRFSSMEEHGVSGLLLYKHRGYSPNLQRWVSRDPIAEDGGANLYTFVRACFKIVAAEVTRL